MIDDADDTDTGLPDNAPVNADDESILRRVRTARRLADTHQSAWRSEARTDFSFLSGHQWTDEERARLAELQRIDIVFNRIEPTIESIAGHELQNRQRVIFVPRQPAQDAAVNELLTHAANWVRDQCDAEDEESDAFVDMLTCGIGVTNTRLDYDDNPDGNIVIERIDPLRVRWDPAARARNLADAAWVQLDTPMTLDDIRAEWPDKADQLSASESYDFDEEAEPSSTAAEPYTPDGNRSTTARRALTVTRHEWFESEPYWRVLDPATNQLVELSDDEYDRILEASRRGVVPPPQQAVRQRRRVYYTAHVCSGVVLSFDKSITQAGFQLNFITGRRDRNRNEWYGVVRMMRDPQRFANKYLSMIESLIRSNAKGGLLIEEGATDNIRRLEEKWAQQDSVIVLNDGALGQGKLQPKPIAPLPSGIERMLEFSVSSIRDVTGINLEVLGMANREQAAALESARREAALTILSPLFNSLRRYRKIQGRVLADMIRRYISDGRLIRIVSGDGTERTIPLLRVPDTITYDVVVDTGSQSRDAKRETFNVMAQLIPALQNSGFKTPPEVLDYLPLPTQLAGAWKRAIAEQQKQPPPPPPEVVKAQIQAQVEQQKLQAEMQREQMRIQFNTWKAQMEAQLEQYKTLMRAQTDAQDRQIRAAIEEQSQIINAQAAEQKAFAETMKARIEGMSKLIDATTKIAREKEKQLAEASKGPQVIAFPAGNDAQTAEMQSQALAQMAQAVQALSASLNRPKRVIRDAAGNIQGVQ